MAARHSFNFAEALHLAIAGGVQGGLEFRCLASADAATVHRAQDVPDGIETSALEMRVFTNSTIRGAAIQGASAGTK
jgi:hypothetical protein